MTSMMLENTTSAAAQNPLRTTPAMSHRTMRILPLLLVILLSTVLRQVDAAFTSQSPAFHVSRPSGNVPTPAESVRMVSEDSDDDTVVEPAFFRATSQDDIDNVRQLSFAHLSRPKSRGPQSELELLELHVVPCGTRTAWAKLT